VFFRDLLVFTNSIEVKDMTWDQILAKFVMHEEKRIKTNSVKSKIAGILTIFNRVLSFPENYFYITRNILKGVKNSQTENASSSISEPMSRRVGISEFYNFVANSMIDFEIRFMAFLQFDGCLRVSSLLGLRRRDFIKKLNGNYTIMIRESKTEPYHIDDIYDKNLLEWIDSKLVMLNFDSKVCSYSRKEYNEFLGTYLKCSSHSMRALGASFFKKFKSTDYSMTRGNWVTVQNFNKYVYDL